MRIQMPWFPPVGLLTGIGGATVARHLVHAGGRRHRLEAGFILALTWFPTLIWLLVQLPFLAR
ncbi:hypothetical protein GETHPA_12640 [Geothrix rubra]|uniref:DUF1294 domain-containing protein n=1 Tax=Geothrix rubra TaxID=2927977 RepID=A0ABQ5Q5X4_9BACT|nr:hypothetical protein [Geothrix rubra]GLH69731.1 hypothetical protein GETHPA_12640 [Geothrix rubra]